VSPDDFLQTLGRERAVAIVRAGDAKTAASAMAAAIEGGFRVAEFTMNTPGALELVRDFARGREDLLVGAGTVLSVGDARAAVQAGARFLVSPVVDEEVIAEAARLGVAIMPGTYTPTEMWRAHKAGAPLQKLFPAPGPEWVRTILAPMPFLRIVPTSGVDGDNAAAYLAAGAYAVGFVRSLFDPALVAARDWGAITARARALLAATAKAPR
jgi:2-dehydro-3-deoxyphosphogluconate aldolase/(4S)-4-hydroxy-2-oxoglutarate aldolase